MADAPQTDVVRRVALPTASLLPRSSQPTIEQDSSVYLESIEEEWNKKVDVEVETLVDGMVDLVSLASVCWLFLRDECSLSDKSNTNRSETKTNSALHWKRSKRNAELSPWYVGAFLACSDY